MLVLSFVRTLALLTRIGPLEIIHDCGAEGPNFICSRWQATANKSQITEDEQHGIWPRDRSAPRISSGSGLAGVCARFLHPHWQHNKLLLSAASDYDQDIYHRGFSWRWSQRPKPSPDKIYSPSASAKTPSSRFLAISASQALCTAGVR